MKLQEVKNLLEGEILTPNPNCDLELHSAFCSDMMSHVLTYANDKSILITAMYNPQVLKTAEIIGVECIIFIGLSEPDSSIIKLADSLRITLIHSKFSMYVTCGLLFSNGVQETLKKNGE